MQPTEHKHKNDVELIDHIKQSLHTHEELYQLGAWERFNELQQQPKRRPLFWMMRVSAVAAILALCITLIWYTNTNPQKEQLVKTDASKSIESLTPQHSNEDAVKGEEQLAGLRNQNDKTLIKTNVGEKNLLPAMLQNNCEVGGEPSGHIILKDFAKHIDGMFVALKILETCLNTNNWD